MYGCLCLDRILHFRGLAYFVKCKKGCYSKKVVKKSTETCNSNSVKTLKRYKALIKWDNKLILNLLCHCKLNTFDFVRNNNFKVSRCALGHSDDMHRHFSVFYRLK